MSRVGKKPIPLPKGVSYTVEGNLITVKGPKGTVTNHLPGGVTLATEDGTLLVKREDDSKAAVHGLVRALVNNAVVGVTTGWTRELEIVGIGYRAEMKGKGIVVFSLGYSHPIEYPLPSGVEVAIDPKMTKLSDQRHRPPEAGPGGGRDAFAASARPVQAEGRALRRREAEEEGRQDGREVRIQDAARLALQPSGEASGLAVQQSRCPSDENPTGVRTTLAN